MKEHRLNDVSALCRQEDLSKEENPNYLTYPLKFKQFKRSIPLSIERSKVKM